ncbi:MAG TPA: S9 family peptidase, partial [Paludibacter sp.]|nr:S9 family peptidase [Paludibacter sp.]
MKTFFKIFFFTLIMFSCNQKNNLQYPETRKENVSDDYWGTQVNDPYRWLEDDRSQETEEWVIAQNQLTYSYLEKIPFRDKLRERLTELMNYPKYGYPQKINNKY